MVEKREEKKGRQGLGKKKKSRIGKRSSRFDQELYPLFKLNDESCSLHWVENNEKRVENNEKKNFSRFLSRSNVTIQFFFFFFNLWVIFDLPFRKTFFNLQLFALIVKINEIS